MQPFHLQDEFTDLDTERAVIAAVARTPALYWELLDLLPGEAFVHEATVWHHVRAAIEAEDHPARLPAWTPAAAPQDAARRLADLSQRRLLAAALERQAQALYGDTCPVTELATMLEEDIARIHSACRETQTGALLWASDLIPMVVQDAEERWHMRQQTRRVGHGLPIGIPRLDTTLGGLNPGLDILAGPPGIGKTALALQIAAAVTRDAPVVYVTFENASFHITQRALAARAGINPQKIREGWGDP